VTFIGLDGYRRGWVAVRIDGRKREIDFLDRIERILDLSFERAAVDIPIGLPHKGNRGCDQAARDLLVHNRSRVFLGARRWILDCASLGEANVRARALGQAGVSAQLFCLSAKIAEADALVRKAGQKRIRETHPELVFWRLNGCEPLAGKKTAHGHAARRALLERNGFRDLDAWLERRLGTGAKPDDVLDACACAIAARDDGHRVPLKDVRVDDEGLRMEIHY
jgi:predicted RNase H-like nuclease